MDTITYERKQKLEQMIGCKICPLTIEEKTAIPAGLFENSEMPLTVYGCVADGGTARGGKQSQLVEARALRPCSEEYGKECDLYARAHKAVLPNNCSPPIELNSGVEYTLTVREQHRGPGFGTTPVERQTPYRATFVRVIGDILYFSTSRHIQKPNLEFRKSTVQSVQIP